MPVSVFLGGEAVDVSDLTWSATDPGGFETCGFTIQGENRPVPGEDILIMDGLSTCWHGRVEEPGLRYDGRETNAVSGVGYGSDLKNNPYSMVYIERNLGEFKDMPLQRNMSLSAGGSGYVNGDNCSFSVTIGDETTNTGGNPALVLEFNNIAVTATRHPITEVWYDAGYGNKLSSLRFSYTSYDKSGGTLSASWANQGYLSLNELGSVADTSGILGGGTSSTTVTATGARRYAAFFLYYNANIVSTLGIWKWIIYQLHILGDHGLTLQGTAPTQGFYPFQIVKHALAKSMTNFDAIIGASSDFIVQQSVYRTLTPAETVIDDMSKFVGWHWGVWEPRLFSDRPTFYFTPPPTAATTAVSYLDCETVDITERYSDMYNQLIGNYTQPNGVVQSVTVTAAHPRIPDGTTHSITVDLGTMGNNAAAEAYALFQLRLLQKSASVSGSATLPDTLLNGDNAHLLRPGRDKLKIVNLPNLGSSLGEPPGRVDDFHVKRISVTVDNNGVAKTQCEFDYGADLIEVLQARLANATEARNLG